LKSVWPAIVEGIVTAKLVAFRFLPLMKSSYPFPWKFQKEGQS